MINIVRYFKTFLDILFRYDYSTTLFQLYPTNTYLSRLDFFFNSSLFDGHFDLITFLGYCISDPSFILSSFVWIFFAVLTVNLLLIWPYKWIRSVIRKCKI